MTTVLLEDSKSTTAVIERPEQEKSCRAQTLAHHMLERLTIVTTAVAAFPERPEEWVDKDSRRIWRQDQIKREYWNQQAAAFKKSKHRAWVLKACYWQWQMSSQSDFLPLPHKDPAGKGVQSQLHAFFSCLLNSFVLCLQHLHTSVKWSLV